MSKNGQARALALEGELLAIAKRQRARGVGSAFVFHRCGKPIHPSVFKKQWAKACIDAGLGSRDERGYYHGKIFHDFRRTAARNLVRKGVPERVAMTITGHLTRSVFERYNIVSDGDLREAARKLATPSQ